MKRLTALVNSLASKSGGPPADPTRYRRRVSNQNNRKLALAKIARKLGSTMLTTSACNWRRTPTRGYLAGRVASNRIRRGVLVYCLGIIQKTLHSHNYYAPLTSQVGALESPEIFQRKVFCVTAHIPSSISKANPPCRPKHKISFTLPDERTDKDKNPNFCSIS